MRMTPLTLFLSLSLVACGSNGKDGPTQSTDADGDGFSAPDDCDDTNADINPEAAEVCDGIDNDCNDWIDDEDPGVTGGAVFYFDYDGDGFGDNSSPETACEAPDQHVTDNTDCNDADAAINPSATEICDTGDVDENCNGVADDDDETVEESSKIAFYADADLDGYASREATLRCEQGDLATEGTDCNDADPMAYPGANEWCDGVQTDCGTEWTADTEPEMTFTNAVGERTNIDAFPAPLHGDGIYEVCGSNVPLESGSASLITMRGMTPSAAVSIAADVVTEATISLSDLTINVSPSTTWTWVNTDGDITLERVTMNSVFGCTRGFNYDGGNLTATDIDVSGTMGVVFYTENGSTTVDSMSFDYDGTDCFQTILVYADGPAVITNLTDTTDYAGLEIQGNITLGEDATISNVTTGAVLTNAYAGDVTIENSLLTNGWGAVLHFTDGVTTIRDSEISGHGSRFGRGAVTLATDGVVRTVNSVIDENWVDFINPSGVTLDLDGMEDDAGILLDVTCTADGCAPTAP